MSKKKTASKRTADRHKGGFLVRLPDEMRVSLEALKQRTGQPYTWAVRKALEAYLKANGVEPPGM